jgi:hypothetical protein
LRVCSDDAGWISRRPHGIPHWTRTHTHGGRSGWLGTAHRKGQLPPGLPLEMTCPPSPSLFGIQFPGGGFFDAGRSATRAPTHSAATRSAANSQFRVFLAFWECTFVRFRRSPREGSDSNAKPSPRRGSGEPQKLIWISGRSHSTRQMSASVSREGRRDQATKMQNGWPEGSART